MGSLYAYRVSTYIHRYIMPSHSNNFHGPIFKKFKPEQMKKIEKFYRKVHERTSVSRIVCLPTVAVNANANTKCEYLTIRDVFHPELESNWKIAADLSVNGVNEF